MPDQKEMLVLDNAGKPDWRKTKKNIEREYQERFKSGKISKLELGRLLIDLPNQIKALKKSYESTSPEPVK